MGTKSGTFLSPRRNFVPDFSYICLAKCRFLRLYLGLSAFFVHMFVFFVHMFVFSYICSEHMFVSKHMFGVEFPKTNICSRFLALFFPNFSNFEPNKCLFSRTLVWVFLRTYVRECLIPLPYRTLLCSITPIHRTPFGIHSLPPIEYFVFNHSDASNPKNHSMSPTHRTK